MNLGGRFIRGSVAMSAGAWAAQAANLAMQVVIARLLGPAAFGLYAFCLAINQFLSITGAFSLQYALVQSREESQSHYDTAFAICGGLGVIWLLLAAAIAPVLWAHRSPDAAWILIAMGFSSWARQLSQVPQARLERALRYGTLTILTIVASVVPNVVAVGLASLGMGAWSLAIRDLLIAGLLLVLASIWSGYRFRARVVRDSWRKLMDFSRPMFVSRSLEILMTRLDSMAVGIFFGNRATGIYHWARFLAETGYAATIPLERVSLNLYARVQDDPARLARSYALINTFLVRAMLAGATVLLIFPSETVRLLLGQEWSEVAPLLRWLGLYAAFLPVFNNVKTLFYGLGQVRLMVQVRLVQAVIFASAVVAANVAGSLAGVAAGLVASTLAALGLSWRWGRDLVEVAPTRLVGLPVFLLAATIGAFAALAATGVLEGLPWFTRPFLPPLAFLLAVFALERAALIRDLRFLVDQAGLALR